MSWRVLVAVVATVGAMAVGGSAHAEDVCGAPSGLNFRAYPSLHAPVKTVLGDGTHFDKVLGASRNGQWKRVDVNGRSGWVSAAYTCKQGQHHLAHRGGGAIAGGSRWESPVPGYCVTSPYGYRRLNGRADFHPGLDLGAPCGTPVHAAAPGRVIYAGWYGGYGNAVIVRHPNGLVTIYGHNTRVRVHPGMAVNQNTVISISGNTGYSFGCHVHFEVRNGLSGGTRDPRSLIGFSHCPRTGVRTGFGGSTLSR